MISLIRKILDLVQQCEKKSPYIADTIIAAVSWIIVAVLVMQRPELAWESLLCALGMSAALVWRRQVPGGVAIVAGVLLWTDAALTGMTVLPLAGLIAVGTVAAVSSTLQRMLTHAGAFAVVGAVWFSTDTPLTQLWLTAFAYMGAYGWGRLWFGRKKLEALVRSYEDMAVQADIATQERRRAADRVRIALDMQDLAAHPLDLLVIQADAGHGLVASDPDSATQSFDSISGMGRRASSQLQRIRELLTDVARREDGDVVERDLNDLENLVEHLRAAGLEVTLEMEGVADRLDSLPQGVETVMYQVVREALAGVIRHSDTRSAGIRVESTDAEVTVAVAESGAQKSRPRPSGRDGELAGLRRRAAHYDATIAIEPPSQGHGARWVATFPLPTSSSVVV